MLTYSKILRSTHLLCKDKVVVVHSLSLTLLWPHGLQHARLPCLSPFPRVCSESCPLSQWCYITISSSADLFSFCLQSCPASESFPMRWPFASGRQSTRASASASVLPVNIQGWFPFKLTGLISLQSKELLKSLPQNLNSNISSLALSLYGPTLTSVHDSWKKL